MQDWRLSAERRLEIGAEELEKATASGEPVAIFSVKAYLLSLMCHTNAGPSEELRAEVESMLPLITDDYALSIYHAAVADDLMMRQKELKEAMVEYRNCISFGEAAGKEEFVIINLMKVGYCYAQLGALNPSIQIFEEVESRSRAIQFTLFEEMAKNNLAFTLMDLGRTKEAQRAYESIKMGVDPKADHYVYAGFAEIAIRENRPKDGLKWIEKSFERIGDQIYPRERGILNLLKADAYRIDGDYESAERLCAVAMEDMEFGHRTDDARIVLGRVYVKTDRFEEGIKLIEKAIESDKFGSRRDALQALVEIYTERGEFKDANRHLIDLHRFEKEQLTKDSAISIEVMQANLESNKRLMNAKMENQMALQALEQRANLETLKAETANAESNWNRKLRNAILLMSIITLVGFYFYFRKASEQRQTSLELEASKTRESLQHRLEQKRRLEAIGLLTGSVAHDFNNLLQVFSMSTQILSESIEEEPTKSQVSAFRSLNNTIEIGSRITDQLLSFSRNRAVSEKKYNLAQLFEAADILFSAAGGDEISISVEMSEPELCVTVDRAGFYNAILNLLMNACDASPPGGKVNVVVSTSRSPHELNPAVPHVSTRNKSHESLTELVRIDVRDSGSGMKGSVLQHCLEDQFTTKPEDRGNGMGLTSVQRFSEDAGGFLMIASEENLGTTVSIFLPKTIEQGREKIEAAGEEIRDAEGMAIAIVEDNELVRQSLQRTLTNYGCQCDGFENGDIALTSFKDSFRYEIVISDVRMPGETGGIALANWLEENHPEVTTILMSGNPNPATDQRRFLRKPFTTNELLDQLRTYVRARVSA